MKATTRRGLILSLLGLLALLSLPGLAGAGGGGANVVRGEACTISLAEVGGDEVTTTDTQSVETPNGSVSLVCRAQLPDGLEPPRRTVRTSGELCETPLGPTTDTDKIITPKGSVRLTCRVNGRARPPATGWATGGPLGDGYGVIIHTTDGGKTWERQGKPGEIPDVGLKKVAAIDAQNAWVVGGPADGYGLILRTRNGGRTWQRQGSPAELVGTELWGVFALDRETAWVTGQPSVIMHTNDGGKTWTQQAQDVLPPQVEVAGIYASDAQNVWAVTVQPALILRTTDGGAHWQTVPFTCEIPGWLIWVDGVDAETVWVSGNGIVMHTADGGATWACQTPPGFGDYNELVVVDRDTLWTVLDPAAIYRSEDGGASWEQQYTINGQRSIAVSAVDAQTAWVVGVGQYEWNAGSIVFTSDGGQHWTVQDTPVPGGWYGVSFVR